jgi:hypothetical protein
MLLKFHTKISSTYALLQAIGTFHFLILEIPAGIGGIKYFVLSSFFSNRLLP